MHGGSILIGGRRRHWIRRLIGREWIERLLSVAGLASLMFAAWLFYDDWRFARAGRPVRGIVAAKAIEEQGSSTRRTRFYVVQYRYTFDGRVFQGEDRVTREAFESLQAGGPVDVLYRQDAPERSRLRGHTQWFAKFWAIAFGSIGTFVAIRSGRSRKRGQE